MLKGQCSQAALDLWKNKEGRTSAFFYYGCIPSLDLPTKETVQDHHHPVYNAALYKHVMHAQLPGLLRFPGFNQETVHALRGYGGYCLHPRTKAQRSHDQEQNGFLPGRSGTQTLGADHDWTKEGGEMGDETSPSQCPFLDQDNSSEVISPHIAHA